MKVWPDDVRETPAGWVRVRPPGKAIELLRAGGVEAISLDHDLGIFTDEREETGYAVLLWIEREVAERQFAAPTIRVFIAPTRQPVTGWSRQSPRSCDLADAPHVPAA